MRFFPVSFSPPSHLARRQRCYFGIPESGHRLQVNLLERTCKNPPSFRKINVAEHKISPKGVRNNATLTCLVLFKIFLLLQRAVIQGTTRQMATQCKIRKAAWIHEVYALRQEGSSPENVATRSPNQAKLRSKTRHQISHTKMNRRLLPVFKIHADAIRIPRRFAHESSGHF